MLLLLSEDGLLVAKCGVMVAVVAVIAHLYMIKGKVSSMLENSFM